MQKQSYFPSPLRKDYNTKPLRALTPIIVKQQTPPPSPFARKNISNNNNFVNIQQKIVGYFDGVKAAFVWKEQYKIIKTLKQQHIIQSGLFFIKNIPATVIYSLQNNKPNGNNYFVYLSGVIMRVEYSHGVIINWVVAYLQHEFRACYYYKNGVREGLQYYYDQQEQLMVISQYKKGQLVKIRDGEHGQFASLINNKNLSTQLQSIINDMKNKNFHVHQQFPTSKLNQFEYFGQSSTLKKSKQTHTVPQGYGLLIGQQQIFMGNFTSGVLSKLGGIKFSNNQYYYGQFNHGACQGYGMICSANKTSYQFEDQQISKSQFQRFLNMESELSSSNNNIQISEKWLAKFSQLQVFHEQYKTSFYFQQQQQQQNQYQNSEQNSEKNMQSQFNIEVEDTISKKQPSIQLDKSNSNQNHKQILKTIPKLSLFQQMSLKQSQNLKTKQQKQKYKDKNKDKDKDKTERNSQKQEINLQNKQNLTQRNQKQKSGAYVVVKSNSYNKNKMQNQQQKHKMIKNKEMQRINQEQKQVQQLKIGKWDVSNQYSFMHPQQMAPKQKISKFDQNNLQKSPLRNQINIGKILKVPSDVSDSHQKVFIQNMSRK